MKMSEKQRTMLEADVRGTMAHLNGQLPNVFPETAEAMVRHHHTLAKQFGDPSLPNPSEYHAERNTRLAAYWAKRVELKGATDTPKTVAPVPTAPTKKPVGSSQTPGVSLDDALKTLTDAASKAVSERNSDNG